MRIGKDLPVPAQPANSGLVVAVLDAPHGLAFDRGRSLTGLVVASEQGHLRIQTDQGVFVLRGALGLSPGMRVILTPQQTDHGLAARLQQSPIEGAAGSSAPALQAPRLTEPSDCSEISPPGGNIIGHRFPIRSVVPDAGAAMPATGETIKPFFSGEAAIRILDVIVASRAAARNDADIRPRSASQTFEATVAARGTDGTLVQTDDGHLLLLPPNIDLGEGTRIVFAFEPAPAVIGAPRAETPFEVIDALMRLLGSGGVANARSSIVRLLPRLNKALPALAAAFLGALSSSDVSMWLGSKVDARLANDLPQLHNRLLAAWSSAQEGEAEADEPWKIWTIPLLTETGPLPLRVYRRSDDEPERAGEDEAKAPARVIFDCKFARTGRVQVDTLCRQPRRCDVVIRTEAPLTPSVRDAVSLAYADAAASVGLVGKLEFRAAKGAFIGPATTSPTAGPLSLRV
jgi:hypothetical protein